MTDPPEDTIETTTDEDYEYPSDNPPPGGNFNPPNPPPGGNPPKTGDEYSDPRFILMLMAICAFTIRYILFVRKESY